MNSIHASQQLILCLLFLFGTQPIGDTNFGLFTVSLIVPLYIKDSISESINFDCLGEKLLLDK